MGFPNLFTARNVNKFRRTRNRVEVVIELGELLVAECIFGGRQLS